MTLLDAGFRIDPLVVDSRKSNRLSLIGGGYPTGVPDQRHARLPIAAARFLDELH